MSPGSPGPALVADRPEPGAGQPLVAGERELRAERGGGVVVGDQPLVAVVLREELGELERSRFGWNDGSARASRCWSGSQARRSRGPAKSDPARPSATHPVQRQAEEDPVPRHTRLDVAVDRPAQVVEAIEAIDGRAGARAASRPSGSRSPSGTADRPRPRGPSRRCRRRARPASVATLTWRPWARSGARAGATMRKSP